MTQLFTSLTEEFNNRSGSLINYVDSTGTVITPRRHYNIRSFYNDDITVPRTMLDFKYNNVGSIDGLQMIVLDTPRIVQGRSLTARTMASLDTFNMTSLDAYTQTDLDLLTIASGNEGWPTSDPDVTVGKDASERYANTIQIVVTTAATKIVASTFTDNILTGFDSVGSTYNIEVVLPSFPAQGSAAYLDLANSFIDFTSDASGGYAAGQTDSFRFNQSLNSLTAGGNTYFQINRNSLTHANLTALTGVRFRLIALGGTFTFKAQSIRLIKADEYTFSTLDVDTKRGTWRRSVPRDSGAEGSTFNDYYLAGTRPKNVTLVGKFNSGHLDAAIGNPNILHVNARKSATVDTRILGQVLSYASNTQIILYDVAAGVFTSRYASGWTLPALTPEKDYMLILEAYENKARVSVYSAFGAFYGTLVGTSGWQTVTTIQRGYIGFNLQPYNYDFSLDYITVGDAEFGRVVSSNFQSTTPVQGATIITQTSNPIDLTQGQLTAAGDGVLTNDPTRGNPPPSFKVVRDGTGFQGGIVTQNPIFIGNPKYLKISGDIFPSPSSGSALRGQYRMAFLDKNSSVGWMGYLRNLLPNQWNHFEIPVSANLAAANYTIIIQQTGNYADTFWLNNFAFSHLSMAWEASPDNGTTWYPFLTAKDSQYTAVNFLTNAGTNLVVRGIALSDTAWTSQYEIIPFYGYPGHV